MLERQLQSLDTYYWHFSNFTYLKVHVHVTVSTKRGTWVCNIPCLIVFATWLRMLLSFWIYFLSCCTVPGIQHLSCPRMRFLLTNTHLKLLVVATIAIWSNRWLSMNICCSIRRKFRTMCRVLIHVKDKNGFWGLRIY